MEKPNILCQNNS